MGGMSAQIPIKGDSAANDAAMAKVKADKEREARAGHDGAWVAHPALVSIARDAFDAHMPGPNALGVMREDVHVTAIDLVNTTGMQGSITMSGIRANVAAALAYSAAWLSGRGCVALGGLMEDAATAEIARAQLWQWIHHQSLTEDGKTITAGLVTVVVDKEVSQLVDSGAYDTKHIHVVADWLKEQLEQKQPSEFLTSDLMHRLIKAEGSTVG
jgi:malate synthase